MKRLLIIPLLANLSTAISASLVSCSGVVDATSMQVNHNGTIELGLQTPFDGTIVSAEQSLAALQMIQISLLNQVPVIIQGLTDSEDTSCHNNPTNIKFLSITVSQG